jgi:hypothetical protein
MKFRALVLLSLSVVASTIPLAAQTCSPSAFTNRLICSLPQLFGTNGLLLPNDHHAAHFQNSSQNTFLPLNQEIGQELSILPLGSSGSGTIFAPNSEGRLVPVEQDSLGPILTERANVIGRRAIALGVAYQYFSFSQIDGIDLNKFPAILKHELETGQTAAPAGSYENDYITTVNQAHFDLNQTVIYAVFGLSKKIDTSIEIPIQAVHFRVVSQAHIVRTQPCEVTPGPGGVGGNCLFSNGLDTNPPKGYCGEFHWFADTRSDCSLIFTSVNSAFPSNPAKTDAVGIGDFMLRAKYQLISGEKLSGSLGLGLRLPTGDAQNFLGSGAFGISPFGALSYRARLSPHVRFGYQWNGHSLLSGDPTDPTASKASLPPAWLYSGGVDYRVKKWFTIAADLIGERVLSASRLTLLPISRLPEATATETTQTPISVTTIAPATGSYSSDAIAVGGKVRLKGDLILIGNVTTRIDNGGLRATVVPLVGLSYAFK